MNPYVQLGLVAEISATYLGFIAVFIIFSRDDGRFAESDKHFVQGLVITATSAIVFALLPRVLVNFLPEQQVWEYSISTALCLGVVISSYQAWSQFIMPDEEAQKVHWGWHVPGWTFAVLAMILFAAAYLDFVSDIAGYVAGITLLLAVSIWCFIAIVFRKFF